MTTTKKSSLISLLIVLVMEMKTSSNANIAEYDEYWTNKARLARIATEEAYHPHPYNVTNHLNHQVHMTTKDDLKSINNTRRGLAETYKGECKATNPIDKCWRCQDDWEQNRMRLADCAIGFGRGTTGGKGGRIYVVTDSSDDDMVNPIPGTLRHAVIQEEPLWIIFSHSMVIRLKQELIMTGNKTIDARGANVHIARGAQITIQYVQNVIIHGLHIHHIVPGNGGLIRDSINHYGIRNRSDGDGISLFGASHVWIDHVSLKNCSDGLIDAIMGSTAITISNNRLEKHDEVFLFGANDHHTIDKRMQITLAFNKFGRGLWQRMPRCRFGFFHVVNNDYTQWQMYAIGGTKAPTIISQGNRYTAPIFDVWKEVTMRQDVETNWKSWTWRSENDLFCNGAYFRQSGPRFTNNLYQRNMIPATSGKNARHLTRFAGPRNCLPNKGC